MFLETFVLTLGFLGLVALIWWATILSIRAHKAPTSDVLRDAEAVVVEDLNPNGRVLLFEEVWKARSQNQPILKGQNVRVIRRQGMTLIVEAAPSSQFDGSSQSI